MRIELKRGAPVPWWVEVLGVVIGVPWAGFFAWCMWFEVRTPPSHFSHLALFFAGFLIGAAIAIGRLFLFPVVRIAFNYYGEYQDFRRGGKRKSDKEHFSGEHPREPD